MSNKGLMSGIYKESLQFISNNFKTRKNGERT